MKGLLKYLSPFAPDQSGAVSALYELGGILVICDAGGCTGNICGFDEPRWTRGKSAIFSAGLRDMDAILGRDERLIEKLKDAADHLDAPFAALIGTPVPAVIATDFDALKQMAQEKTGLPVLTAECTGTRLYDEGEQEAFLELFSTFAAGDAGEDRSMDARAQAGMLGVLGCTPLDISRIDVEMYLEHYAEEKGYSHVLCYGMGAGLEEVRRAGAAAANLVVSPAGVRAAEYLKTTFGIPYETGYPFLDEEFRRRLRELGGKRILIVHQQVEANEIRNVITGKKPDENIVCGTWFMQLSELKEQQDVRFDREDTFRDYVEEGRFDAVIADPRFKRALPGFEGEFIPCPHFAVSGILEGETE